MARRLSSRAGQMELTLEPGEIVVDSFAGGGGASLGIHLALGRGPHIAINHDKEAIALHRANHPDSEHYAEDVWHVDPRAATRGRKVGLMWLSPDCKHFSKAKGGKPVSKKIRGLAWTAVRWANAVAPRVIVLENVEEFQTWGPLDPITNKPCPLRRGKTFRMFVRRLERLGYEVQWRELRACDFGAPTIRKRLFLIARRDGRPILWPQPTHGPERQQPWRTAAECIEWSIPCPSIFERERRGKKPLAENTKRRIARGVYRYVIDSPTPFIVGVGGRAGQSPERPLDRPYQTITAKADAAIAVPFLKPRYGEDMNPKRRGGKGQAPRVRGVDLPMPVIVPTGNGGDLVATFMAQHNTDVVGHAMTEPVSTIVGKGCTQALVASHVTKFYGTSTGQRIDAPLGTVTSGGEKFAEVRAFLVAYYGSEKDGGRLSDPVRTVTSKERFGLVTVAGVEYEIIDIGMRMLAPRELYRAQGFPDSYRIDIKHEGKPLSKTAQVRMCGNSVCPPMAEAIIRANLAADSFARTRREEAA